MQKLWKIWGSRINHWYRLDECLCLSCLLISEPLVIVTCELELHLCLLLLAVYACMVPGSNVKTTLSRFSIVKIFYHQYYDKLMKRCKGKVLSGDSGSMLVWYFLWFLLELNCTVYFWVSQNWMFASCKFTMSLPSELILDQHHNNIIITIKYSNNIIIYLEEIHSHENLE